MTLSYYSVPLESQRLVRDGGGVAQLIRLFATNRLFVLFCQAVYSRPTRLRGGGGVVHIKNYKDINSQNR